MRKREPRVTRSTPVAQLPELLTRAEVAEFLALGRAASYTLLRQRGIKVPNGQFRLRRAALLDLLQEAS